VLEAEGSGVQTNKDMVTITLAQDLDQNQLTKLKKIN